MRKLLINCQFFALDLRKSEKVNQITDFLKSNDCQTLWSKPAPTSTPYRMDVVWIEKHIFILFLPSSYPV
jgi:hypothetical protein